MGLVEQIIERQSVYRLWQSPFAEAKFAPVVARGDVQRARRVLDVGCGPGTNCHHFAHADYVGIDCNPDYIEFARRRYGRTFVLADITQYMTAPGERFDFILINSFLHHIDTPNSNRILSHLSGLLTDDGHIHILELVLPDRASVARRIALWDRGKYPRPLGDWEEMFAAIFEPVTCEPYPLKAGGITLWNMVYFKGRRKR